MATLLYKLEHLYTSLIDHFTPQHIAFEQSAACLSIYLDDTVYNSVTRWVNVREKHLHGNELQ